MSPTLSVVIPTHDTRALTLACLRALRPELPSDAEVIVVDDGSRDDTVAAIAVDFPAVRVLGLTPTRGFTGAVNAGLAVARGDLLWLLNSDTEIGAGAVAAMRAAFARKPRLGAAGAALFFPDGRPQWSGGRAPTAAWLFALASGLGALGDRLPGYRAVRPVAGHDATALAASPIASSACAAPPIDWVPGTALAIRAEAWRAVGPFDEELRLYAQDVDLCLRLRAAGWEIAVVPEAHVLHHGGATIGSLDAATTARQEPRLLWTDLARVLVKHHDGRTAARMMRALRAGAALRVVGRMLATPFVPARRRAAWRRDTTAYTRARAALVTLR